MTGSLAGKLIVVPESRELDLFARMLEDEGAATLRCPMVTILDLDDDAPAIAWLKRLAAGEFTDLILLTGRAAPAARRGTARRHRGAGHRGVGQATHRDARPEAGAGIARHRLEARPRRRRPHHRGH